MQAVLLRSIVTIALVLCAAAVEGAALGPDSKIGYEGVGPIVFGSTVADANAAGAGLTPSGAVNPQCSYYQSSVPGLSFMVVQGAIVRADVVSGPISTHKGLHVGDPVEKLRRSYSNETIYPSKYDPHMHVVVLEPRWNNAHAGVEKMRIVIETDDKTVRSIVSGYTHYAELVEHCS